MDKNRLIAIAVVGCVIFFGVPVIFDTFLGKSDPGYKNLQACDKLRAPISREELIKRLGEPMRRTYSDKGTILIYKSTSFAVGPVRMLVDEKTRRVIGTKCYEGKDWKYFK